MLSIKERKLALFSQVHQLKRQLDNLKREDIKEAQLSTYTGRKAYVGLMDLIAIYDSRGK